MALPVQAVQALTWVPYLGSDQVFTAVYAVDLNNYSVWSFTPSGNVTQLATLTGNVGASGVNVDNTSNAYPVAVQVGNFTENIPAYTKSTLTLGGSAGQIVITGQGSVQVTFYKGAYPGAYSNTNLLAAQQAAIGMFLPSGVIMEWGGQVGTIPTGWSYCNGAAVSRSAYAALFNAIGTIYGAGDGATTFNLPDRRGVFVRGLDDARGIDGGRVIGSFQATATQDHQHLQTFGGNQTIGQHFTQGSGLGPFGTYTYAGASYYQANLVNAGSGNVTVDLTSNVSTASADVGNLWTGESRPPNSTTIWIIKQ